jgi:hypothetical protein
MHNAYDNAHLQWGSLRKYWCQLRIAYEKCATFSKTKTFHPQAPPNKIKIAASQTSRTSATCTPTPAAYRPDETATILPGRCNPYAAKPGPP